MKDRKRRVAPMEIIGVVIATASAFYIGSHRNHDISNNLLNSEEKIYPSDVYTPDELLEVTAQAVLAQNRTDSFEESGEFTREIFEQVRRSTFKIEINSTEETFGGGTAWCAKTEGPYVYLVTNKHVLPGEGNLALSQVRFWRPGIDQQEFSAHNTAIKYTTHDVLDLAVIRIGLLPEWSEQISEIEYTDNNDLTPGQQTLLVGHPAVFDIEGTIGDITAGTVARVDGVEIISGVKTLNAVSWGGFSGSPIVIIEEGRPIVSGIANSAVGTTDSDGKLLTSRTGFISLDINNMIETIENLS